MPFAVPGEQEHQEEHLERADPGHDPEHQRGSGAAGGRRESARPGSR